MRSVTPTLSGAGVPPLRLPVTLRPNASEIQLRHSATPEDSNALQRLQSVQSLYAPLPNLRVTKPRTSISPFTARENQRLQNLSCMASHSRPIEAPKTDRISSNLPSEEDYKRVLDRLSRLTARGTTQRLSLQEGKSSPIDLEEDEWAYAKFSVKGFRTPLHIAIKRYKGKVAVYISKTVAEPSESACDERCREDKFIVTEAGLRFKAQTVYFAFHATEPAQFAVIARFGPLHRAVDKSDASPVPSGDREELAILPRTTQRLKSSPSKDFLAMNMQVSASTDKLQKLADRRSISEKRRREVLDRRQEHFLLRKEMAIYQINRYQIKQEERIRQQRLAAARDTKESAEKRLISAVFYAKFAVNLMGKVEARKEELRLAKLRVEKMMKIQQKIRRFLHFHKPPMIAMLHFQRHLRVYYSVMSELQRPMIAGRVKNTVENSFQSLKITRQFTNFFEKGEK